MKHGIFIAAILLLAASCQKAEIIQDTQETTVVRLIPESLGIDIESKSDVVLGETDIYCFAFRDGYELVEGYPVKQSEINEGVYSYVIPKMNSIYLIFAIIPEGVEWELSWYDISFKSCLLSEEPFGVYKSTQKTYDTSSSDILTINAELVQVHHKMKIGFKFSNMPVSPEKFITGIQFALDDTYMDRTITVNDLTTEEIDGTQYMFYNLTGLRPTGKSPTLYIYFETLEGIYMYNASYLNDSNRNCRYTLSINYSNFRNN